MTAAEFQPYGEYDPEDPPHTLEQIQDALHYQLKEYGAEDLGHDAPFGMRLHGDEPISIQYEEYDDGQHIIGYRVTLDVTVPLVTDESLKEWMERNNITDPSQMGEANDLFES